MIQPICGLLISFLVFFAGMSAIAQTPGAAPVASGTGAWEVTDIREIEVDGDALRLSPDGSWLAGTRNDRRTVCIWDVETLTPTCAEVEPPVQDSPLLGQPAWAPDSSALAFVAGIPELGMSSDVMVLQAATGELTNLTRTPDDEVWVHTGPAWTSDSQRVLFAQTDPSAADTASSEIVHIGRSGSESEPVLSSDWNTGVRIYSAPFLMPDDSVLFRVDLAGESAEGGSGLWHVAADGSNPTLLIAEEAPVEHPVVAGSSDHGRYVYLVSMSAARQLRAEEANFLLDLRSCEIFTVMYNETEAELGLSTDIPADTIALRQGEHPDSVVLLSVEAMSGEPTGELPAEAIPAFRSSLWAENDTVFLPTEGGGMLITLEQVD